MIKIVEDIKTSFLLSQPFCIQYCIIMPCFIVQRPGGCDAESFCGPSLTRIAREINERLPKENHALRRVSAPHFFRVAAGQAKKGLHRGWSVKKVPCSSDVVEGAFIRVA